VLMLENEMRIVSGLLKGSFGFATACRRKIFPDWSQPIARLSRRMG
jgi:hypothetical protein